MYKICPLALVALVAPSDQVPPQYVYSALEHRQNGAADHVAIVAGDLDGDGFDDVVSTLAKARLRVWRGRYLGGLEPAGSLQVEAPVVALALGDFDADGILDVTFTTGPKVFVAFGDGAAGFGAPLKLGFVNEGVAMVARDLDGDGSDDVGVLSRANGKLRCWLADGAGGFHPVVSSTLAQGPEDIALADLDGDGLLDAALADTAAGGVAIARGMGDGTFVPIGAYPSGSVAPTAIALGDLDKDGVVDFATAGALGFDLQQRAGLGDGSFGPLVTCDQGLDIVLVDWDGDGRLDRITRTNSPKWLPASGTCGFGVPLAIPISGTATSLAVLDSNGDGNPDLAFGAASHVDEPTGVGDAFTSVGVVEGDGKGGFLSVLGVERDPASPSMEGHFIDDVDGDGFADLLMHSAAAEAVFVRLGTGLTGFLPPEPVPAPGVEAALLADLDGDDLPDLVARGAQGTYSALNRSGSFAAAQLAASDTLVQGWSAGDLNGDGFEDLAFLSFQVGTYSRLSRGNGHLTHPIPSPQVVFPTFAGATFRIADLDGDSFGDLVVGGGENGVRTYRGAGDGHFLPAGFLAPQPHWSQIAVGDLNGDGIDDVVVAKSDPWCLCNQNSVLSFLSDGTGGLNLHGEFEIARDLHALRLVDLKFDGALDLVAHSGQGVVVLSEGDGAGGFAQAERYGRWGQVIGAGRSFPLGRADLFALPLDAHASRNDAWIVLQR